MSPLRLFFALPVSAVTAMRIADWRDRSMNCAGKPVPPANFHITLAFIGSVKPDRIESLCNATDRLCSNEAAHCGSLTLDQTGYWPKPGILWLGPHEWPNDLTELASRLRQIAISKGAKRDRNIFQPHVTLFRRCVNPPALPAEPPNIRYDYDSVVLFESRQGKSGVSYHTLCEWRAPGQQ